MFGCPDALPMFGELPCVEVSWGGRALDCPQQLQGWASHILSIRSSQGALTCAQGPLITCAHKDRELPTVRYGNKRMILEAEEGGLEQCFHWLGLLTDGSQGSELLLPSVSVQFPNLVLQLSQWFFEPTHLLSKFLFCFQSFLLQLTSPKHP